MTYVFWRSLADRQICKNTFIFSLLLLFVLIPANLYSRSAFSPRHSGMEPPGGPRHLENIPGRSIGQTPSGGRGYTDAYGNSLDDSRPEEKKIVRRRMEIQGHSVEQEKSRPLPDPARSSPLWKF